MQFVEQGCFGVFVRIWVFETWVALNGKLMGGQQVLKIILQEYALKNTMGRYYSTLDLAKLRWHGDSFLT